MIQGANKSIKATGNKPLCFIALAGCPRALFQPLYANNKLKTLAFGLALVDS